MRKSFNSAVDQVWFTSDLHFGHRSVIQHSKRPFADIDEMDRKLILGWNSVVAARDHIFVLGDFSFRKSHETLSILAQLNGIKYLLLGNHDKGLKKAELSMFDGGVEHYHEIDVDDQRIVMCHFAFRSWNKMHYGSWNLHGHSHGTLKPQGKQIDVGVDTFHAYYMPMSFIGVQNELKTAPVVSVDHHVARPT